MGRRGKAPLVPPDSLCNFKLDGAVVMVTRQSVAPLATVRSSPENARSEVSSAAVGHIHTQWGGRVMRRCVAACLLSPLPLTRTSLACEAAPPVVPDGFTAEKAVRPPLIQRPIFATFDKNGFLFVGESNGENLKRDDMLPKKPHWITRLEDTDGDGVFDKSVSFVVGITLPQGMLCCRGSVYAAGPPSIWKFTDTNGDGMADQRDEIHTGFGFSGNACDTHGPFLSPTNRLFIAPGRHGHEFKNKDGKTYSTGKAISPPNGSSRCAAFRRLRFATRRLSSSSRRLL